MAPKKDPHEFETPRILHDLPLKDPKDEPKFRFNEYAVTLARLIADKHTRTPFTLGISGAWGTGKTTLLHRIQAKLDETLVLLEAGRPARLSFINPNEDSSQYRVCRTVWFNAWKYAGEDQILAALVRVVVQKMFEDDLISKGAAKIFEPFTDRRDVIDTVLSWFSIKTPFVDVKLSTGTPRETPFSEKTALLDLFNVVFDRLMAAWVHRKLDAKEINPESGVLVVFIDDLDRCLPAKMVQVLEAIKLFMDKPGCVFVLGADKDVIERAVEKVYESQGVKGQAASDYLEKVIQLRFNLPPIPDEDMDGFVKSQVADSILQTHWRIVTLGAEFNPRKVKTFLNDLLLQWAIWQNTHQALGVNFDDFVRWEVVMRSAPAFRRRMFGIYDAETRARLLASAFAWALGSEEAAASFRADLNEQLQRVLKDIAPHKDHFTAEVIKRLVFLTASAAVEETKKAEAPARKGKAPGKKETVTEEALAEAGLIAQEPLREPAKGAKRTPGGLEIFEFGGIEFVKIPAGEFIMGSTKENRLAFDDERPQFKLNLPYAYYMARFPVTNAQYAAFGGKDFKIPKGKENHPVVNVSWRQAQAYIDWLNQTHQADLPKGHAFSLPSEAEWEKAARGEFGNEWPWGNQFDQALCNTSEGGKGTTTPVGAYSPQGDSPYGCADMVGNVWEWTRSLWKPYPYRPEDGREDLKSDKERVVRGGSFDHYRRGARCAARYRGYPDGFIDNRGFRVLVASPIHL